MNDQENDKDPNRVSNQDMREYKSSDQGVADSGGLTEAETEETEEDSSNTENQTNNL